MEYTWYRKITENDNPNIKIIEDQIESFLFAVQHQEDIKMNLFREELIVFTKLVIGKSIINQLSNEHQEKFLEINRTMNEFFA